MSKRVLLFLLTNLAVLLMMSVVFFVLGALGILPPGAQGSIGGLAVLCLVWGMVGAMISLQISRWMAKRAYGIQLVDGRTGDPTLDWLHMTIERQTRQRGLPMPEVGVYESHEVNAFATGPSRRRSLVAVSTGLLRGMSQSETEAVLAHEVSHVANGDMVTMALLQGVVNAFVMFLARIIGRVVRSSVDERIAWLVYFVTVLVLDILLGILGAMIVAAFSRRREFRADAGAAELAGRESMIAALRRLMTTQSRVDTNQPALANFKIAGHRVFLGLLASHPPLEARIAALQGR
jgi:heat shock protein HtpX